MSLACHLTENWL